MSATVDGHEWVSHDGGTTTGFNFFDLHGYGDNNSSILLEFTTSEGDSYVIDNSHTVWGAYLLDDKVYGAVVNSGTISITKNKGKFISGTFEFTAVDELNHDTIRIEAGTFEDFSTK